MSEDNQRSDSEEGQAEAAPGRSARKASSGPKGRGEAGRDDNPTKLHSPLFPLLWLLFPFLAMLTYGLLTRH